MHTDVIGVPQKSLRNKSKSGVSDRISRLSRTALISSNTNPHWIIFEYTSEHNKRRPAKIKYDGW